MVELSQSELVVVLIIKNIDKISIERVDILYKQLLPHATTTGTYVQ